jgi:hypothetical protein
VRWREETQALHTLSSGKGATISQMDGGSPASLQLPTPAWSRSLVVLAMLPARHHSIVVEKALLPHGSGFSHAQCAVKL